MPNNVELVRSLDTMLPKGQEQADKFTKERLIMCMTPIISPLTKNTFLLPSNVLRASSPSFLQTISDKRDRRLALQVKSVIQYRRGECVVALENEPGNVPPTFTHNNKLYQAPKSALLKRFKAPTSPFYWKAPSTSTTGPTHAVTQLIVDLSMVTKVMASSVSVGGNTTVKDFCDKVWGYINNKKYDRIDVVGDNYETPHLLKNSTRVDRGSGTTVAFDLDSRLPANFKSDFFFCSINKARLYRIMTGYFNVLAQQTDTQIFITQGSSEVSNALPDSTHLEADFRLIGHLINAAQSGCTQTVVRGNDTDILVILLAYLPEVLRYNESHTVLFDCGSKATRFMFNINYIGQLIGLERCRGLLFLFALSGSDFTPSFYGVGKLRFFDLYIDYKDADQVFRELSSGPEEMTEEQFKAVETFVLAAYQTKGGTVCDLRTARIEGIVSPLVASFRQLPPTESALYHATLRAVYVSGHLWGRADEFAPELPPFEDWGWEPLSDAQLEDPNAVLRPIWTAHFDVDGTAYSKLSKVCNCGEKNSCLNKNCSCSHTVCLPTCKCRGGCKKDTTVIVDQADESDDPDTDSI